MPYVLIPKQGSTKIVTVYPTYQLWHHLRLRLGSFLFLIYESQDDEHGINASPPLHSGAGDKKTGTPPRVRGGGPFEFRYDRERPFELMTVHTILR